MTSVAPLPMQAGSSSDLRPGQQLLPGYVVKLLKTLKIPHGTDRSMNGVDVDPTIGLISHIVDCMGALRDVNKVYRAKGSIASRSVGSRAMFGFTAELGNILLDAITFNPPIEFSEAAIHYTAVAGSILKVFPEIASQVTKDTGKMLIHHTALKAVPIMAMEALKIVVKANPAGAACQDCTGALPLHWITHNMGCNFELISFLISANPQGTAVADLDGYLPLHWAVNQDNPNIDVVAALLASDISAASKPCNKGSLPLHWCVNRDNPSLGVVEALLQSHPDSVRTFCDDGWLPIHRAVDRSNIDPRILRMLIDLYPQGLQCPNSDGQLPLHRALDHHSPSLEAIQMMLEAYPGSAQVSDDEGYLALHLALDCANPSVAVCRLLLDHYPEAAHRKSRDGLLPLHCIISSINPPIEIIKILLDLFPESPEHAAVDVVPLDETADPDTWRGEWVKKKWSPLTRAIGRKLDAVVTLLKTSLHNHKKKGGVPTVPATGLAGSKPIMDVSRKLPPQSKPPINSPLKQDRPMSPTNRGELSLDDDASDFAFRHNSQAQPYKRIEVPKEFLSDDDDERVPRLAMGDEGRDRDRDRRKDKDRDRDRDGDRHSDRGARDRDRDRDRHRRASERDKDRDRDRDRDRGHGRDRDRGHSRDRDGDRRSSSHKRHDKDRDRDRSSSKHRNRDNDKEKDTDKGERERAWSPRAEQPAAANGTNTQATASPRGGSSESRQKMPVEPPPKSLREAAARPTTRRGLDDGDEVAVRPLRDLEFSDTEEDALETGYAVRQGNSGGRRPVNIDDMV